MLGLQSILSPFVLAVCAVTAPQNIPQEPAVTSPLITSSVKLRVDAENAHSWGTGTIIDTRQGEALILTCGHIFRDSQGKGKIEVHLFGENSTVKVFGTCLYYDLEIDLALVTVAPPCPVRAVPIAPAAYQIQTARQALSVGCDHGGNPTLRTHQIMSTDRIGTPKENKLAFHYIQVSGAPVSGRSGGGLFSPDGYLIGVCNTADPVENDGHFVPQQIIRHVLDQMNLAEVYKNPSLVDKQKIAASVPPAEALTALTPLQPLPEIPQAVVTVPAPMYADSAMSREEQATLEEIKRRKQDGDEVILIVRSRRNPEVPSDVIILNGTSDQFLDSLVHNQPAENSGSYNPVIFSSHETAKPENRTAEQTPRLAGQQPVSFPVRH